MPRENFNDFLYADAGPSTPQRGRGRGRGGGGGSSSGFRGSGGFGRGGRGTPIAKRSYTADYTNMKFDYTELNNKKNYGRMDGEPTARINGATG